MGWRVEQQLPEVDGVDAVDERLVGLGEERDPAALEALDEVDLPQRAGAVERSGHDPRRELEELARRTRARQRGTPDVEAEVEASRRRPTAGRRGGPGTTWIRWR